MFFSYEDDFGSLRFDEHPSILLFVQAAALHCSRNVPKTQRQSEHLITHSARLSHIILHDCEHRINNMHARNCLLTGRPVEAQKLKNTLEAEPWLRSELTNTGLGKSYSRRPWWGGS